MYWIEKASHEDYLAHSAKGSTWKNHKYIDKKQVNGKWVYIYNKNASSDGSTSEQKHEKLLREYEQLQKQYDSLQGSSRKKDQLREKLNSLKAEIGKIEGQITAENRAAQKAASRLADNKTKYNIQIKEADSQARKDAEYSELSPIHQPIAWQISKAKRDRQAAKEEAAKKQREEEARKEKARSEAAYQYKQAAKRQVAASKEALAKNSGISPTMGRVVTNRKDKKYLVGIR